jgi:hypothetical protein
MGMAKTLDQGHDMAVIVRVDETLPHPDKTDYGRAVGRNKQHLPHVK